MKKRTTVGVTILAFFLGLTAWMVWGNTTLKRTVVTVGSDHLPEAFDGYRIAQVSDLHNTQFGDRNEMLLSALKESKPDLIAITGDMIDSRRTDVEVALQFAADAMQIAPCYYVTGNHESRVSEYKELKAGLEAAGVTVLENARVEIGREGQSITLIGVLDPAFQTDYLIGDDAAVMQSDLDELAAGDGYRILLSHRPELFDVYVQSGVDLVLSGHAHGGQFRLPMLGGLFAPGQGFFPEYDAGLYTRGATNMVVSRGIGNSVIPIRFNNRPEIVLIDLTR